jgi:hypothetical protein
MVCAEDSPQRRTESLEMGHPDNTHDWSETAEPFHVLSQAVVMRCSARGRSVRDRKSCSLRCRADAQHRDHTLQSNHSHSRRPFALRSLGEMRRTTRRRAPGCRAVPDHRRVPRLRPVDSHLRNPPERRQLGSVNRRDPQAAATLRRPVPPADLPYVRRGHCHHSKSGSVNVRSFLSSCGTQRF